MSTTTARQTTDQRRAAQCTAETFRQVEGTRPLWQVPQLHNRANYAKTEAEKQRGRTPTYERSKEMLPACSTGWPACMAATRAETTSRHGIRSS